MLSTYASIYLCYLLKYLLVMPLHIIPICYNIYMNISIAYMSIAKYFLT